MLRAFLNFESFLFPKLTTIIYWIGLVLIVLGGLIGLLGALASNSLLAALGAVIGAVVGIVIWRITIELWMVLFSIYDVLREIRDQRRV